MLETELKMQVLLFTLRPSVDLTLMGALLRQYLEYHLVVARHITLLWISYFLVSL